MADDNNTSLEELQRRLRALRPEQDGDDDSGPEYGPGAAPSAPDFSMFQSASASASASAPVKQRVQRRALSPGSEERRGQQLKQRREAREQIRNEMLRSMKKRDSSTSPCLGFTAALATICLVGLQVLLGTTLNFFFFGRRNDRSLSLPYRKTKPGEEQPERWGKVRDDYAAPGFFATWYDVVGVLTKTLFVRAERQTLSVQAEVFLAPSYGVSRIPPLFPILVALQTWRLIESCFASRIYTLGLRDLQFAPGYIASLRVREGQRFNPLVVEPVEKKRIARGLLRGIDDGVWSQEGGGPSNVTTT
uniref:Transmembrane protein n=1 Tax=Pyricularia oryzae (strain P131) TaxID=1143193 RepID=L7JIN1_PYRO1